MDIIVGIADLKISNDPDVVLVTYSLGSCIGLAIYDPVAKVGGLLHYMLPDSTLNKEKAKDRPFMFCDTGVPILFKSCFQIGAQKSRVIVKAAGGSQLMDPKGFFDIGKRNYASLRKILWRNNVLLEKEDIGGSVNRTMRLNIKTGEVSLKVSGIGEVML
ncbi:MAG: chemotaxis protein CheD [Pseudomonadota bacterium]